MPVGGRKAAALSGDAAMNADAQRLQQFAELVRNHEPIRSRKFKELLPLRDAIAEARRKGASYETIRIYLRQTAIEVSADTVGRSCRNVWEEQSRRKAKRNGKRRLVKSSTHTTPPNAAQVLEKQRARASPPLNYRPPPGPRIADPQSL